MAALNQLTGSTPAVLPCRVIVVGLVRNEKDEILICKMPPGRGVFPGQWGLPGGGIEEGEQMETALKRELREELGLEVSQVKPLFFSDGRYKKTFPDGSQQELYMIFLIFSCYAADQEVKLNPEFEDYAWAARETISGYNLNTATIETLHRAGWLSQPPLVTRP